MEAAIKRRFPSLEVVLVPGAGGAFEVSANGELLYSKKKTGEFPDEEEIIEALGERF